jgi:hypothetical protein
MGRAITYEWYQSSQSQRRTHQEVVSVVVFETLVLLADPLQCAICPTKRTTRLLLVRVIPQDINVLLLARDLDDILDERDLAKT